MDYKNPQMFDIVHEYLKENNFDLIIGSSMGGYFAYCLSTLLNIDTILFNPALHSRSFEPIVKIGNYKTKHKIILGTSDVIINPKLTNAFIFENKIKHELHLENNGHRTPLSIFIKYI